MRAICSTAKPFFFLVLLVVGVTAGLSIGFKGHAAAYANNELIGDSVYLDSATMTPGQIQDFLVSKGSYLRNYVSFSGRDNANVGAAQIIYEAAQDYGINPQVILATLQKEESLVTDPTPSQGQLNFAMGYGCADSSGCSSYSGFYNQIDNATWQLRFNYERASGNNSWWRTGLNYPCNGPTRYYSAALKPGNNVTFYDDYGTGYTNFVIANASTGSLYCYTPHAYPGSSRQYFSGSYNFVVNFEAWFGSVIGDLVRSYYDGTVFLVSGNNKYPIADSSVLNDFGGLGPIRYVSNESLAAKTTGSVLGHMVGRGDGTLYFVNAGIKLPFTTCTSVADYGYSCGQIIYLTDAQLNKLATGPLATARYNTTSGKQFYISAGKKREIFDNTAASQAGITASANTLLEAGIAYLPYGLPVIRNQVVAVDRNTSEQFYFDNNTYLGLTGDMAVVPAFASLPHSNFDDASVPAGSRNNSFRGLVKNSAGTQFYVLLPTGKALLSSPSSWPSSGFMAFSDTFISGASSDTTGNINSSLVKPNSNGTVYYLSGGVKRPIPSWDNLLGLHVQPMLINSLPDSLVDTIPTGAKAYAAGRLVKTASSGTVYVTKDLTTLFTISSFTFPQELGLSTEIGTLSSAEMASYTVTSSIRSKVVCSSNNYVGTNGVLYLVTSGQMTTYGFNQGDFVTGGELCANLPASTQTLPNFIRTQDGTIYQVESGQKKGFTNYQAYLAHGGNSSNTVAVNDYFASTISSGPLLSQ